MTKCGGCCVKDMGSEMFILFLSHYLVFHEEAARCQRFSEKDPIFVLMFFSVTAIETASSSSMMAVIDI